MRQCLKFQFFFKEESKEFWWVRLEVSWPWLSCVTSLNYGRACMEAVILFFLVLIYSLPDCVDKIRLSIHMSCLYFSGRSYCCGEPSSWNYTWNTQEYEEKSRQISGTWYRIHPPPCSPTISKRSRDADPPRNSIEGITWCKVATL